MEQQPKKFKLAYLISILVIIVVVVASVWYLHKPKTQQAAAPPAGWSSYKASKYGFEFNYPNLWGIPHIDITPADVGRTYNIDFLNIKDLNSQGVGPLSIIINMDTQNMSNKVCGVNDPSECGTAKATTSTNVKKQLAAANKSHLAAYTTSSLATVSVGPGPNQETLFVEQIVDLTNVDVTAAQANYTLNNAASDCTANGFSPTSSSNCITKATYQDVSKVLNSLQNI